jgi:hypothetical protein
VNTVKREKKRLKKDKLFLKAYRGCGSKALHVPLSALDVCDWSVSCSSHFIPEEYCQYLFG